MYEEVADDPSYFIDTLQDIKENVEERWYSYH